ncbi:MAG TPA: hypothetical protein VG672_23825 [Bryobacteraceae bacterium]|nr:hypothetical protein [Bryobacteraceae bacterium]
MKPALWRSALAALAVLLLAGPGRADSDDDAKLKGDSVGERPPASFKPDKGLQFSAETAEAIGLRTAPASQAELAPEWRLTVQVFQTGPVSLASGPVAGIDPAALVGAQVEGGRLVRIEHTAEQATGQAEVIVALDGRHPVGDFIAARFKQAPVSAVTVPLAAVLDSPAGTFVYVAHEGYYRRTAVRTGASTTDRVEIVSGLRAGDTVVTAPVQTLWLTELKLTMAGSDPD